MPRKKSELAQVLGVIHMYVVTEAGMGMNLPSAVTQRTPTFKETEESCAED
jgi:hypothetical protein